MEQRDSSHQFNDLRLLPLIEVTSEWFEELRTRYELACGVFGKPIQLSSEAIVFRAFEEFRTALNEDYTAHRDLISLSMISNADSVVHVENEREATEYSVPTTWVETDGGSIKYDISEETDPVSLPSDVYIYERHPFEREVNSLEKLQQELDRIMGKKSPDLSQIEDDLEKVAENM